VYIHERIPDDDVVRGIFDRFDRSAVVPGPSSSSSGQMKEGTCLSDVLDSIDTSSVGSDSQLSTAVVPPVHTDDSSR
jgi:hypothetical protein